MGYWIPDSRWEDPSLLIPGDKPIGPVEVDWSNPITSGMQVALIFNGEIRNIGIGGAAAPGAEVTNAVFGKQVADCSGADGSQIVVSNVKRGTSSLTGQWTSVYCRVYYDILQDHTLTTQSGTSGLCWAQSSGGFLRPAIRQTVSLSGTTDTLPVGDWVSWGCRMYDASTIDGDIFVNGKYQTGGNTGVTDKTDQTATFCAQTTTARESNAKYEYIYFWNRRLSSAEFASIHADPYQVLIPE